jgi:capsular polysaccharide biosynthesis protein
MAEPVEHQIELGNRCIPGAWMFSAQSYLIDRFVPDCEQIYLSPKGINGGTMRVRFGDMRLEPPGAKRRFAALRRTKVDSAPRERVLIDMRHRHPSNWAHFLNNHLPVFFALSHHLDLDWATSMLLVPAKTPSYIHAAAALFGLELMESDDVIEGSAVTFDVDPWVGIRAARPEWVRLPEPETALEAGLMRTPAKGPTPKHVFLSRKDSRIPENQDEIARVLSDDGFETVFAEDFTAADQFRLFLNAERVVAVHGAGLAPLLYCRPGAGPKSLVEILPCGHVTDVYRAIADFVGCKWVGVRGRIKQEYVTPAYDLNAAFRQFSLDKFTVDTVALQRAIEQLGSNHLHPDLA